VGLDAVIARCLSRKPEARYQSVTELAQALIPFAPAGAGAAPDPMARLLASVAPETRARLDSVLTTATPSLPSILPVVEPAMTSAAPPSMTAGLTAMQGQGGEPTFASWGKTDASRTARSRLLLVLAGLLGAGGLLAMVLVIRVILTRGSTPQTEAASAVAPLVPSAPVVTSASAPASAPVVTAAAPPPEATVEPVISAVTASASASAAPRHTTVVAAAVPAPKPTATPRVTAPTGADPFGRGRK
jgi:serine/threonine-protein kinase